MNTNFAKVMALLIVGSVAKAFFRVHAPVTNNYYQSTEEETLPESPELELVPDND